MKRTQRDFNAAGDVQRGNCYSWAFFIVLVVGQNAVENWVHVVDEESIETLRFFLHYSGTAVFEN